MQTAGGATLIFDTELLAVNEKPAGGEEQQEEDDGEDVDDTYGADELWLESPFSNRLASEFLYE